MTLILQGGLQPRADILSILLPAPAPRDRCRHSLDQPLALELTFDVRFDARQLLEGLLLCISRE